MTVRLVRSACALLLPLLLLVACRQASGASPVAGTGGATGG
ncbi:TlpA family protein disulfide reductase, partial [Xanthomonas perforans]